MVAVKNVSDQLCGWRVAILGSGRAGRGARGGAIAVWRYLFYFPLCVSRIDIPKFLSLIALTVPVVLKKN